MGTRGLFGYRMNGQDKLTYNHFDSYPSGLGQSIVDFLRISSVEVMKDAFDHITLVNEHSSAPTHEQIQECLAFSDTGVSHQTLTDWYCLLRKAQGNIEVFGFDIKYMIDNHEFILDSLFCEWAYIINLDTLKLEVWEGFQKKPQLNNRYGNKENNGFYPCALVAEFPLDNIPENWINVIDPEQ